MSRRASQHPETKVVVYPRSKLLAQLAQRDPQSLEAKVLTLAKQRLGAHSLIYLDQDQQGLHLIIELCQPPLRVGYLVDEQLHVLTSAVASTQDGQVKSIKHSPALELDVLLCSLKEWATIAVLPD